MSGGKALVVNGWTLFAHPIFLVHLDALIARVEALAWVSDEDTKRVCESADDACRVFRRILDSGHPPSDGSQLLAEARAESERLARLSTNACNKACQINCVAIS
jgi:hypothetical protein